MSTSTLNESPPVVGEQLANDRLDALIAEHNLPDPVERLWCDHGQQYKSLLGLYDLIVRLASEADVTAWAAALGVRPELRFHGWDVKTPKGMWWSVQREFVAEVREWLPGMGLTVKVIEHRSVGPDLLR